MPFFSYLHNRSDITDVLFRRPRRYAGLNKFTQVILRGKSELSIAQRELIAAFVSATNACQFCAGIHTAVAERFGVPKQMVENLMENIDTTDVEEKMKPLLRYCQKLTLSPAKMEKADAQSVFAAGWSEDALDDAVDVAALFNFYNRFLEGHGIKGYPEIFESGSATLHKQGYNVPPIIARLLLWNKQRKMSKVG
ncbi:MAG: peroxidase-related enzyme [Bacteroidota bacterium]